jgi:hypothetical protein
MIDIPIGEELKRADVHSRYGGNTQKGISTHRKRPYILLFSTPSRAAEHGYPDMWGTDGCYHYCGEGRIGDQLMTGGNLRILLHKQEARRLHLFRSEKRRFVKHHGEFELPETNPWYSVDAPGDDGRTRRMIIFRLRPVEETISPRGPLTPGPSAEPHVEFVPLESHKDGQGPVSKSAKEHVAVRREGQLLKAYRAHLEDLGHEVGRNKIKPVGERNPLFTDLYDETENVLVEAKGNVTREAVRMAVGQLFDYRRYIKAIRELAVLLPERPRTDLVDYCASLEIATIWRTEDSFTKHKPN